MRNGTLNKTVVDIHERNEEIKNYLECKMDKNCYNLEEDCWGSIIPIEIGKIKPC